MTSLHTIPLSDDNFHIVSDEEIASLQESFPNLDVPAEIANVEAWLASNAKRRRMTSNMSKFVFDWLSYSSLNQKNSSEEAGHV